MPSRLPDVRRGTRPFALRLGRALHSTSLPSSKYQPRTVAAASSISRYDPEEIMHHWTLRPFEVAGRLVQIVRAFGSWYVDVKVGSHISAA